MLVRPSSHTGVFAATRQQTRLIILCLCNVAHARVKRCGTRVPTLFALPIPLRMGLLSPRSVDQ